MVASASGHHAFLLVLCVTKHQYNVIDVVRVSDQERRHLIFRERCRGVLFSLLFVARIALEVVFPFELCKPNSFLLLKLFEETLCLVLMCSVLRRLIGSHVFLQGRKFPNEEELAFPYFRA